MKKLLCIFMYILLNISVVLSQETLEELNKKGLDLYNKGKYEEAITCFDKALKINNDVYQVWNNKGLAYYKLQKYKEAIKCFEKALSINPGYTTAWYNKGSALFMMKNYNGAIVCFDKVLQQDPKHSGAKTKKEQAQAALDTQKSVEGLINKGTNSYNQGKYEEAVSYYDKALTLDPGNETALVKKGDTLAKEGKYDEAIKCYDKVLSVNPKNIEALYGKGTVFFAQGKYKEAIEYYNKILAIKPDDSNAKAKMAEAEKNLAVMETPSAEKLFQEGEKFFNQKNLDEAIKCYDKVLTIEPKNSKALLKKGDILAKAGQYDKALECYNKVAAIDPGFHEIQTKIQETQKALSGQNTTVSPSSEPCRELYMKGSSLYSQGKFSEALEFYDKALDINPDYAPALFEKGLVLNNMKKGKSKEARECFVKATLIDPQAKELNLNIKDNFGNTPLHLSIISDNMNSIKILTLKGADVNIKNNEGNTPLHITARFGNVNIAKILVNSGGDVNIKNNDGLTPLHAASANGHLKMAEFLIKNGSDINAKNNKGETPLNVAGTGEMRELLKKEAKE